MRNTSIRPLAVVGASFLLAACGGGGGSTNTSPSNVLQVSGSLPIVSNQAGALASTSRSPKFVSLATANARLFIDGIATPSGAATTCTATNGTGTSCTIAWSANVTVPASHTFTVETDTGAGGTPANTALSEGSGQYVIIAGNNTLTPMSLNGIVVGALFTVTSCTATSCSGNVTLSDASGNAIVYGGALTVPTNGQTPTSGNVYDNNGAGTSNVTITSATPAVGTITGIAQGTTSSYTAGTLTTLSVNATGIYTFSASCVAAANGTFGLTVGGAATKSGNVTPAELAALTPAVTYPAAGVVVKGTPPSFTCSNGNISSATGTLPVN